MNSTSISGSARFTERARRIVLAALPDGMVRRAIKSVYWSLPYRFRQIDPATDVVRALENSTTPIRFVQVGANDGSTGDFLSAAVFRHRWDGVLIEPHPETFAKLTAACQAASHLQLVNVAISPQSGRHDFYYLPDNPLVASFSEAHVRRYAKQSGDVQRVTVDCLTMMDLLAKYDADNLDLLAIDTEGYDAEIIKSIDFSRVRCQAILFETTHLSDADKQICNALLTGAGYWLLHGQYDSVAIDKQTPVLSLQRLAKAYQRAGTGKSATDRHG